MIRKEMKGKTQFFFDRKMTIHVSCLDGQFYNGLITEIHEDFFIINDRMLSETPVYFSQIKKLERYMEENK